MTEAERIKIKAILPPSKQPEGKEEGEIQTPDIKVEAISCTIGYGNGDARIETEAFEIRVPLEIRIKIKGITTCLVAKNSVLTGRFTLWTSTDGRRGSLQKDVAHAE
jgi:hypothetical protein